MQVTANIMEHDSRIFDLIEKERMRQTEGIELIASENFTSPQVIQAVGSILTNKYAEGYPGKRYYGGCEVVDEIENLARNRAAELFDAEYVNVQPHSGSQANAAIFLACLKPGDKIMGFDLSHGGHLTHGSPVNFSGKTYNAVFYGVEKHTGLINYEKIKEQADVEMPKMIICGASAYSRDIDYSKFRDIADGIGALLLADISHPSGLIAKGILNDPLPHCDFVTSTTHKTLRGPRGGIILMGRDFENPWGLKTPKGNTRMMSNILDMSVFPGIQGGPLEHVIAGKAVAFGEALSDNYFDYMVQVQKNANAMAEGMISRGYDIISGGTSNHLMLIDLRNKNITGKLAESALVKANITVNKNMVPFDDKSPFVTSGIRIGTPAITSRGLIESDMESIVSLIDEIIKSPEDETNLKSVGEEVIQMMAEKPLFV
tara:strand:- start:3429 stop:4721 length:1293 start_codon:yes stop_codon:yes gene_type:complete